MDTLAFLTEIFKYSENNIYLWTNPGKHTHVFTTEQLPEMAETASRLTKSNYNVYFGVGTTKKQLKEYERPKNEEIASISALWVDIDVLGKAHKASNLPPDVMSARDLLPAALDPSIVVHSGYGLHAYYLLREELILDTEMERKEATELIRRLQNTIRQSAAARGWHLDAVFDLTRVLRVPGTLNFKIPNEPAICQVIESSDTRYNISDFDVLPELAESPQPLNTPRVGGFERRDSDGSANLMMANCAFLQYWQLNYKTLPEPIWMAACTNLIRGVGGEEMAIAAVKDWLGNQYNDAATMKKIEHWFNGAHPTTCQFIQQNLNFQGCTQCGVKSPCCWSLEKTPQARALLRKITVPNAENVFTPEILGALAVAEKNDPAEYAKFREKCKNRVNLNDLSKAVKTERIKKSKLEIFDGGQSVTLQIGQKLGDLTTKQFVPDTPLNLAIPVGFAYSQTGVDMVKTNSDGNEYRYSAAGAPVIISERIYNVDNKTEKIQLTFRYFDQWANVIRKRSDIFAVRNIVGLTDYGLNTSSESAKYLVKYLQALEAANTTTIPLKYAVSKIGWREHSLTDFVIPGRDNYRIDMEDEGEITEAFTVRGSFEEWKNIASRIRTMPFARFILAAAFAAPLLKIFKNRNFMVYFWGTSGGGKTASQVFALSVWGSPSRLMKSFYGTQNGIEKALTFSNDFPMLINEKQVMSGKDKQDMFEQLVYMLEGGRSKVRATKTGLQKTSTWRSIGMASGEEPLSKENSIQGVKTRLLELNVYPVIKDDDFAKSLYSLSEDHHGYAGELFIKRLILEAENNYEEINAARIALTVAIKKQFPEHFNVHIDNVATVAMADLLSSQWIFDIPQKQAEQEAYEMACTVMAELPTERQISDVERGWDFVQNWLAANDARFDKPTVDTKLTPSYGFKDVSTICIYPDFLTNALKDAGFSPDKLIREFANKNRIEYEMDGNSRRTRIQVHYKGKKTRVIKINDAQQTLG